MNSDFGTCASSPAQDTVADAEGKVDRHAEDEPPEEPDPGQSRQAPGHPSAGQDPDGRR